MTWFSGCVRTEMTRIDRPEWLLVFVLLSLPVAWFIGRAIGRLHYRSRAATVVIAGASAAVVGAVTVSVLSATDSFFPSAAQQTAAGMVLIGVLIGEFEPFSSRSTSLIRPPVSRHAGCTSPVQITETRASWRVGTVGSTIRR